MDINAHLSFDGRCDEALKFYETCIGAKTLFKMTYGESPMKDHVPSDWQDKILHATVEIDGQKVMGADSPPGRYESPRGIVMSISLKEVDQAENIFRQLSEGGTVTMPIQETFWALKFGMLIDKFGIPWMINCERSDH